MITIATTHQYTTAQPQDIFELWRDVDHWAEYDHGIEWAKLIDTYTVGGRCIIKPKGDPVVRATFEIIEPNQRFVDTSRLFGARLTFDHRITQTNGNTSVIITQTIKGILAPLWVKILGKNQQGELEVSTANLIAKAEGKL